MLHYLQNLFQALDVSSLTDAVLRVAAVFLCLRNKKLKKLHPIVFIALSAVVGVVFQF